MRVALCNPPWLWEKGRAVRAGSRWPHADFDETGTKTPYAPYPFWLSYSAALLKEAGHIIAGLDGLTEGWGSEEFLDRLVDFKPDLILFESSTPSYTSDLEIAQMIKEHINAEIVLAGSHVTVFPKEALNERQVNYVLIGEYEYTLLELVNALDKGESLEKIPGLTYREDGAVQANPRRPLTDLNSFPMPAFEIFHPFKYIEPFSKQPNVQLLAGRGCPFKCIFCLWPATMYGVGTVRYRAPDKVAEEVDYVLHKFKPREIYFDDDTFTYPREKVYRICDAFKEHGLTFEWTAMGHCGVVTREMLEKMHEAGCEALKFGIESGDENILRAAKKSLTVEHAKRVFNWCREIGIRTHATLMIGLPGESWRTIKKTFDLLLDIRPESFQVSIAVPFPGTEFYKMAKEKGWLVAESWDQFAYSHFAYESPVIRTDELSPEDIRAANRYANTVLPFRLKIARSMADPSYAVRLTLRALAHPIKTVAVLQRVLSERIA